MRVNLAQSAGFCFGVRRALRIALETAAAGGEVCMLGDLVHNEDVLRDIAAKGIRRIKRLAREGRGALLICAHGAPRDIVRDAAARGYRIVDATCPMVRQIHKTAERLERDGRLVVVIGDKRHDEVRGIVGQLRRPAVVISSPADAARKLPAGLRRVGVVVQSTQTPELAQAVLKTLRARVADVEFHETICRPTRVKQKEMMTMPLVNDVMIIIGSRTSANTRRLYEISLGLNPRSHWISGSKQVRPSWFIGAASVGVAAGASTPDAVTRDVVRRVAALDRATRSRERR